MSKATITGTATGGILEDDINPVSGSLTVTDADPGESFANPQSGSSKYGSWSIDKNGTWNYNLDNGNTAVQALPAGATLTDTFTVSSQDLGTTKTVTVTITGVNDVPTFGGTTTGTVAEDGTLNATGTVTVTDKDTGQSAVQNVGSTASSYGTWFINTAGQWSYKLDNANATVQGLITGQQIQDHFTIHSKDGSAAQIIDITINGADDKATLVGTTTASTTEDSVTAVTGTMTVTDKDAGQSHSQFVDHVATKYGTYSVDLDGHWTYQVDNGNATVQGLTAGQTLTDTFLITSQDGGTVKQIGITINGANDAAQFTGDITGTTQEDAPAAITGTLVVNDADAGQNSTKIQGTTASTGGFGTYTVDSSGHWTYKVNNTNTSIQQLGVGQHQTDTFTVQSKDGTAQVVTITINGTNDPAAISGATMGSVTEGSNTPAQGTLTVTDIDSGDNHTIQVTDQATSYGKWSVDTDGHWSYLVDNTNAAVKGLTTGQTLTDTFTVQSKDGTANQQVSITINGTDNTAHFTGDKSGTATEDAPGNVTGTLIVTDPDGGQSTVQNVGPTKASYGTWSIDTGGHWQYKLDNTLAAVQGLHNGDHLTDTFTINSKDGSAAQPVTITINGTNDIANISGQTTGAVQEDGAIQTASGTLNVVDKDNGDSHSQTATNVAGKYGTWNVDADGHWNYQLNNGNAAVQALAQGSTLTDTFKVTSFDGGTIKQIGVTITGTNDGATINGQTTGSVTEDGTLTTKGTVTVSDIDNGQAHTQVQTNVATDHGSYSVDVNGHWTFTLDNNNSDVNHLGVGQTLTDHFTLKSTDGTGTAQIDVTINGANDAPNQPTDSDNAGNNVEAGALPGTLVGITVNATDVDNGDTVTYSLTDNAGGRFTIDPITGVISVASGGPAILEQAYSVTAIATDNHGQAGASQTFSINANPLVVDQTGANGAFTTIQAAVDHAATLNGPIHIIVKDGTYHEQVQIDGHNLDGLTIEAAPGASNVVVSPPTGTWESTANSPTSGRDYDGLITVDGADNVTLRGMTVDGQSQGDSAHLVGSNDPSMVGIVYVNTTGGVIDTMNVTGIREGDGSFGDQRNVGIVAVNAGAGGTPSQTDVNNHTLNTIEIKGSTVTDFQKAGIQVANADANIHDNHVTGVGSIDINAQNGIQVSGSTGTVDHNTVSGIGYTKDDWAASDILTFENRDLAIDHNSVTATPGDSTIGIAAEDSTGTTVTNNTVDGAQFPIDLEDYSTASGWPEPMGGGTYDLHTNIIVNTNGEGAYFQADPASAEAFNVTGTDQNDTIITGAANDTLNGGAGDDQLDGGTGNDAMTGGAGNDTYSVDSSTDSVTEGSGAGSGTDTVLSHIDYTLGANVENLTLVEGNSAAAVQSITFDETTDGFTPAYPTGKIADGENGWSVQNQTVNQQVEDAGGTHGQVWHIVNNPTFGSFGDMPQTPSLSVKVAEPGTPGASTDHMTYSLDIKPVSATSDGSRVEIDFANSTGQDRENFMVLEYTAGGIRLAANEPLAQAGEHWAGGDGDADFNFGTGNRTLVDGLDPSVWHNIQLTLVANDGGNNDVIQVYVDGKFVGETTTFENYRDYAAPGVPGDHDANVANNLIDHLIFRVGNPDGNPNTPAEHQGFLIDNINTSAGAPIVGIGNGDDNVINGNSADNQLSGLGGNDTLNGGIGYDTLTGGGGNDTLDGGEGKDTAVFSGALGDHTIAFSGSTITVSSGADGTDSLHSIENLKFADTTVLIVDQSGATSPYTTIQAAVDAAKDMSGPVTVLVRAGDYHEQVVADGHNLDGLTIKAAGDGTVNVIAPNTLVETAVTGANWLDSAGRSLDGIVTVKNADNVTIQGITVDGNEQGVNATGSHGTPQLVGIVFLNASGAITDDHVTGTKDPDISGEVSGVQRGMGVYVFNDTPGGNTADRTVPGAGDLASLKSVAMSGTTIDGFQKNGAVFWNSDLNVHDNTITGQGVLSTNMAQNGIEVFSSTGSVAGNQITGIDRADVNNNGSPSGILTFDNNNLHITGNTITGMGPDNQLNGIYADGSIGAVITGNTIENANTPIEVDNATSQGDGVSFSGNTFTNDADPNAIFDPDAANTNAFTVIGSGGTDELHGGAAGDTLNGNGGDDTLEGRGGDDTINGGTGNDTATYNVGDGHDTVDGGANTDTVVINHSDATPTTFTVGANPDHSVEITASSGGGVTANNVEDLDFNLGSGGDTVNIGSLGGTTIAPATITVHGGDGGDTVDASGINATNAVGVNFDGGKGDDTFTTGQGDDTFTGGAGHDVAVYSDPINLMAFSFSAAGPNQTLTITSPATGTDTLSGVEQLNVGSTHVLVVGAGGYATIQSAIDAAGTGDVILVGKGTFNENVNVNKSVTIMGQGDETVIQGTFRSENHIPDGTTTAEFLQSATGYLTNSGNGVTIAANNVTLENLKVTGFNTAVELGSNSGLTASGVHIDESVNGFRKGTGAVVTGFDLEGGSITNSYIGINIAAASNGAGDFSGVTIHNTHFENLTEKGIYAEQLSNAVIDGISMENVGEFGRGPAFGSSQVGQFGAGIDINLKYESYSNIEIKNFDLHNTGHSFGTDSTADNTGGAILVKARDDAPSYSSPAAHLSGVTIHDGSIDGTGVAIRTGEPAKGNAEPALTINNVEISHADISQYDNQTHSVTDVTLTGGDDTAVAAAGSIGEFDFHGGAGNDGITGGGGDDKLEGGAGNDSLNGGGGHDTAVFKGNIDQYDITWDGTTATVHDKNSGDTGGDEGTDTITGVGRLHFADHDAILVGQSAEFTTIQSGVDAAQNGDAVLVGTGVFTGDVNVASKSISIDGFGRGAGDHTEVDGTITFSGTVDAAAKVSDLIVNAAGHQYGVYVSAGSTAFGGSFTLDNVLVENSQTNGFAYILAGNEASPTNAGTLGNIVLTNDLFTGNATTNTGSGGRGDIILFGYNRDLTMNGVEVNGANLNAQKAIQIRGIANGSTVYTAGTFDLSNIKITGTYPKDLIAIVNYAGFTAFNAQNFDLNATAPWGLIHLDGVGGTVDLSHLNGTNGDAAGIIGAIEDRSSDDHIFGTAGHDVFTDGLGADNFDGKGGDDVFVMVNPLMHTAAEFIEGGLGTDTIYFADTTGGDTLVLSSHITGVENVTVAAGTAAVHIDGHNLTEGVTITGNNGDNHLTGGGGNDTLYGNDGNDTLDGGAGTNTLVGGKGDDVYFVHNSADVITEVSGQGHDVVHSDAPTFALPDNVEDLFLDGNANIDGTGNNGNNTIVGNDGDNTLDGKGGIDYLDGGKGADHLIGGPGADTLHGGQGDDTLTGNAGGDTYQFSSFADGHDVITDFDVNNDNLSWNASLDLNNNGIIDELSAQITSIEDKGVGQDVVVHFGANNDITFQGIGTGTSHGTDITTIVADPSQVQVHSEQ